MKYIRTKDGRIAEIKENMVVKQSDVLRLVYKNEPNLCVLHGDDEIIKQADTIEELCDDFVIKTRHGGYLVIKDARKITPVGAEIFGAIWTDKGLTYVAKMNDKGELELL